MADVVNRRPSRHGQVLGGNVKSTSIKKRYGSLERHRSASREQLELSLHQSRHGKVNDTIDNSTSTKKHYRSLERRATSREQPELSLHQSRHCKVSNNNENSTSMKKHYGSFEHRTASKEQLEPSLNQPRQGKVSDNSDSGTDMKKRCGSLEHKATSREELELSLPLDLPEATKSAQGKGNSIDSEGFSPPSSATSVITPMPGSNVSSDSTLMSFSSTSDDRRKEDDEDEARLVRKKSTWRKPLPKTKVFCVRNFSFHDRDVESCNLKDGQDKNEEKKNKMVEKLWETVVEDISEDERDGVVEAGDRKIVDRTKKRSPGERVRKSVDRWEEGRPIVKKVTFAEIVGSSGELGYGYGRGRTKDRMAMDSQGRGINGKGDRRGRMPTSNPRRGLTNDRHSDRCGDRAPQVPLGHTPITRQRYDVRARSRHGKPRLRKSLRGSMLRVSMQADDYIRFMMKNNSQYCLTDRKERMKPTKLFRTLFKTVARAFGSR